ncbi:MAG: FxLYD domain-containing protein [Candidatus Rokuibacteriota bacterium]
MRRRVGSVLRAGSLGVVLATVAACAPLSAATPWPPGTLQPLVIGWQQYFRIQWQVTRTGGHILIDGHITNTWGFTAQRVRVLVNGYDPAGRQIGQLIAWGPNEINPGGRVYFDVSVPAGAATYDVSVFSWNWVQVGMNVDTP